jgi:hypothetical protein
MSKPRLLDLFCGAGGAGMGYHRAGFEVVGVDINWQPDYAGDEFHRGDAMTFPLDGFDVIHASPPCKRRTPLRHVARSRFPSLFDPHPDLVTPTFVRLRGQSTPWVVENVPGPDFPSAITLCGSMFGLRVRRHRVFASSVVLPRPPECRHAEQGNVVGVYGNGGGDSGRARRGGGGGVKVAGADAAAALGIDWTTHQPSLAQAIPPAYTEWIGAHLLRVVSDRRGGTEPVLIGPE